jgi:hypothetical protein
MAGVLPGSPGVVVSAATWLPGSPGVVVSAATWLAGV